MARKKKQATPAPSKITKEVTEITESLFIPASAGFPIVHEVFDEGDELVTPAPGLVHPSAGMITRRDAELLALSFGSVCPKSNGTVKSPITVPLHNSSSAAGPAANIALKNSHPLEPIGSILKKGDNEVAGDRDFNGKLTAKGFALKFVSPQIKEAIKRFIANEWRIDNNPDVYWHYEGYFIINLRSLDNLNSVMSEGPHMFYGKPVKPWTDKFDFSSEILRTIPLWVKIPNLPLNCWGAETLSKIRSTLGVPICADECTSRHLRVSFAKLLIEIDITKPLAKSVWVESPKGEIVELKVIYEWIPPFCTKCNKPGHNCDELQAKPAPIIQTQKKVWVQKQNQGPGKTVSDTWETMKKKGKEPAVSVKPVLTSNKFDMLHESDVDVLGHKPSGGRPPPVQ
ncbi:uncharacterized protein LOC110721944 [Chenopodium quinoa]|uniref:uncharacterized protein LOC110721944 n=1 Tax=Chenopodium quinoa TaxID=63459 RepID=UPI000B78F07E|nr:uncharacterized protein LOC110721944 [Chenopodium quinoa]